MIVTFSTDQDQSCRVICLNLEIEKTLWNSEVFRQIPQQKEQKNSYATTTPVLSDSVDCAVFGNRNHCQNGLDWKGKRVNDVVDFYSRHGLGASPALGQHINLCHMTVLTECLKPAKSQATPKNSSESEFGDLDGELAILIVQNPRLFPHFVAAIDRQISLFTAIFEFLPSSFFSSR